MDGQIIRTGRGKVGKKGIGIGNHQVNVEGKLGYFLQGFNDRGAYRQIWHEMAIHDVNVQQIRSASLDRGHLVGQAGKVGR
jgi:hypothetical protein